MTAKKRLIMLTAKGEDMDKILGLEYGADDYITKPFNILEVKARIKAILRRAKRPAEETPQSKNIEVGGLRMDCESRRVYVNGKEVYLTAKETCLSFSSLIRIRSTAVRTFSILCGDTSIRAMCAQSMSISVVCARKSRRTRVIRSMFIQNGV